MKNRILALIMGFLMIFGLFFATKGNEKMEIYFCKVGQGDGIVIRTEEKEVIVIDGGPDRSILDCIDELSVFKIDRINKLVLTHPHKDHVSGLLELFDRYEIDQVLVYGVEYESREYAVFREKLQDKSVKEKFAGESMVVGQSLRLEVVWPIRGYEIKNLNDSSLVLRVESGKNCFLMTGDAGADFEQYYIANYGQCSGLKVAHHGSKFATSREFVEHLGVKLAVISSGENTYGHPSKEVIDRLDEAGAKVLRTDEGTIKIVSEASGWYIADTK